MRSKSKSVKGIQVFAVAGTNVVSFGITATKSARSKLLGFAVERVDTATNVATWVKGYKVFKSQIPNPTPTTDVSTYDHPIQSLVWDDFIAEPNHSYDYVFHPVSGAPGNLDRTAPPVTISVTTEPLNGSVHDVFFNRGVTASQYYATHFDNKAPGKQKTPERSKEAYAWLARELHHQLLLFIESAKKGDSIRGCFYEFEHPEVLKAFKTAIDKGVDVRLIVDEKVNGYTRVPTPKNKLTEPEVVDDAPRKANLRAIGKSGLPATAIVPRVARKDVIAHNKFMVILRGKSKQTPSEVWTGSTNVTESGIFGQANVGHRITDEPTARAYLAYWKLLQDDPGAPTEASKEQLNIDYLSSVAHLSPAPTTIDEIQHGITPVFSPRSPLAKDDLGPLALYVDLVAKAKKLSCVTFAFGIPDPFRQAIHHNDSSGPVCFMLLEKKDNPRPKKQQPKGTKQGGQPATPPKDTPAIYLNSKNNTYEAHGSDLSTAIGKWVKETNNKAFGLTTWVNYIHLKMLLHDPLGADPIVVTGSANFSVASTFSNDENMIIIRGDRRVADIYFTEFNRLWGHYQYRSVVEATAHRKPKPGDPPPHNYQFLYEDTEWQTDYEPGDLRSKRVEQYATMAI
jgi:phosphatidylserine/phosphatidylglycerophosphate/cardiolipin synthase-like enzyme